VDVLEPGGRKETGHEAAPDRHRTLVSAPGSLSRKTQFTALLVIAALLAAGALIGPSLFRPARVPMVGQGGQWVPDGSFKPTPQQWASFTISPVQQMMFRAVQETDGKIANDDDITTAVFSPFTGRVSRIFVKLGDRVKRGDPLLAVASNEFVQAQNDLISAAATLRTARAQLNLAETNEKRNHALYQAQGGALKDWQQSQVDLANSQGGMRSAEIALGAVRNRLGILGKSDAEIDAMENASEPQRFNPESLIVAPIDGIVVQRQVGLGQNVTSQSNGGSAALFSIGDILKVWLLANARETDASLIHPGDPVEVRVPAYPGRVFRARISYVAPSLDPNTHRLPVRAEVENPDGALKPEMFASFAIVTGAATESAAVPQDAIVYEGSDAHVWVAHPQDRTIVLRQIHTERVSDGMVQVTKGLHAGEQVVTRGSLFIDRATAGD
jgi:membrane fusion protein, heavy metal efflux system